VGDVKAAAAAKLGIAPDRLQLFWHKRELTAAHDCRTLTDMNWHTGTGLQGYDLTAAPVYFPPVVATPEGLAVDDSCT